jgi:dsRNA-specific ribonuclease
MTQQCINDKAIADAVEALIGAHLISLGLSSTLKFMKWLDIKVLLEPKKPESPLLQFVDSAEDVSLLRDSGLVLDFT